MKPDKKEALIAAVDQMSPDGKTDIIFYSGPIDEAGYAQLMTQCTACSGDDVILFLTTIGGSADAAFKIAKLLQFRYKKFSLCITDYCKSAGTLIAIGAHELVFAFGGELGPLDIQLRNMDELGEEYMSGLDTIAAISALNSRSLEAFRKILVDVRVGGQLSTSVASKMATDLVTGLYANVYQQIEPLKLGSISRSMEIALAYGTRLNKASQNLKQKALAKLISGYPSHSFVILHDEAEDLFHNVRFCSEPEMQMIDCIADVEQESRIRPDRGDYDQSVMVFSLNAIAKEFKAEKDGKIDATPDDASAATKGDSDAKPTNSTHEGDKCGGATSAGGDHGHPPGAQSANNGDAGGGKSEASSG